VFRCSGVHPSTDPLSRKCTDPAGAIRFPPPAVESGTSAVATHVLHLRTQLMNMEVLCTPTAYRGLWEGRPLRN
jgi:hypothetical protein